MAKREVTWSREMSCPNWVFITMIELVDSFTSMHSMTPRMSTRNTWRSAAN